MNIASILSTLEFGVVFGLLALSLFSALSTGLLSLASITFAACGAFLFVHLGDRLGLPPVLVLLGAAVIGGLAALVLSVLLLHLESHYIAMATIAVVLMTRVAVLNLPAITGGVNGMPVFAQLDPLYIIGALAVSIWVFARLRRSRFGLAAEIAREDTTVAATLGINVRTLRTVSFVISGAVGGLAGALLASLYGYIDADTFFMDLAFVALAAVVLGGAFHWAGALVGGVVFTILPELLRGWFDQADQLLNGVILVVIMIFLPRGLVDPLRWTQFTARFRGRGTAGTDPGAGADGDPAPVPTTGASSR
jgi:branched-chain amino acid transport system permease protein